MNSFYSAKSENIFYYILTITLLTKYRKNFLTMVHIVIQNGGSNGDILHSKHQNLSEKYKNLKSTDSMS